MTESNNVKYSATNEAFDHLVFIPVELCASLNRSGMSSTPPESTVVIETKVFKPASLFDSNCSFKSNKSNVPEEGDRSAQEVKILACLPMQI